jgi:hypothetical protein
MTKQQRPLAEPVEEVTTTSEEEVTTTTTTTIVTDVSASSSVTPKGKKAATPAKAAAAGTRDVVTVSIGKEDRVEMGVLVALIVLSNVVYLALPLIYPVLGIANASNI